MTDTLGWIATALFVGSYFFKPPALLRAMQMSGALLWIVYGALIAIVSPLAFLSSNHSPLRICSHCAPLRNVYYQ